MKFRLSLLIVIVLAFASLRQSAAQDVIPLTLDQPITGQVTADVFRQIYSFSGRRADVIALSMTTSAGTLDPLLILTDGQGTPLARSTGQSQPLHAAIASFSLPQDGTYFVIATRFGQDRGTTTGTYTLTLSHVGLSVTPTGAAPTSLHYGDSIVGQIGPAAQQVYSFSAQRGDLVTITMQRISGDLDSFLILTDPQGHVLLNQDDDPLSPGTLDAGIRDFLIRTTGNYQITATRFGQAAGRSQGTFSLTLSKLPIDQMGGNAQQAILLDYGATGSGSIDSNSLERYYRFEAHKGDVITLDAERTSGNLDPTLTLYDPALKPLAQNNQGQRGQSARLSPYPIRADGTYYVVVSRYNAEQGLTAGNFSLTLVAWQGTTIDANGDVAITYGSTVTSEINNATFSQEMAFSGKAGDVITLDVLASSGNLQPSLILEDGYRHLLSSADPATSEARIDKYKLPYSGQFIIVVTRHGRSDGTSSGSYTLTLATN